jgi:Brp/Blh family beta-carotene 15,15'-monooxygenase
MPAATGLAMSVAMGLPHGAFDYLPAKTLLRPRFGRAWPVVFGFGYVGLAATALAGWRFVPRMTLFTFLAASAFHFGEVDAPGRPTGERLIAGFVPILTPALAYRTEVSRIFDLVAGTDTQIVSRCLRGPVAMSWAAYRLAVGPAGALRDAAAVTLFVMVPPLHAFSSYFALVHTPRGLASVSVRQQASTGALVALSVLGWGAGYLLWRREPDLQASDRTTRAAFRLLSALTVPHMLLQWWSGRRTDRLR